MSYVIKIGSTSDTSGIDKATGALKRADQAADEFVASIKAGVGIDIGGKIVNSISAIPSVLTDAISRGLEFNKSMMDSEIGIANVLAKFQGLNKEAAKDEAAKAMAKIVELEPKTAGGLDDLVQGFLATVASAQSAGVSVEENIDLVGKFANALANANIDASQLSQELRAIFTGNITPDASLAKILNITSDDIARAKEAGNLVEILNKKIGSIGEAGDSAGVRISTFNSAVSKALGKITEPIFDELLESITALTKSVSDPKTVASLRALGFEIASVAENGVAMTQWAIKNAPALAGVAKGVGLMTVALATLKISQIVTGLVQWTASLGTSRASLDAETASLARNSAGQAANAATRRLNVSGSGVTQGATGAVGQVGAGLVGRIIGGASIVAIAASIYEAVASAQKADLAQQNSAVSSRLTDYRDLVKRGNSVTTPEERDKLVSEINTKLETGGKEIRPYAAGLNDLVDRLRSRTDFAGPANGSPARDTTAADAQRATNNEFAQKSADEANRAQRQRSNAQAETPLEIDARIVRLRQIQRDNNVPDTADPRFQEASKTVTDVRGEIEDLYARRADLVAKAAEDEKTAQIESLNEQLEILRSQGDLRLAQAESANDTELEAITRRKSIEDEIASKRLDIENQIGKLQGESALKTQARAIIYEAEAQKRTNSLESITNAPTPGSLSTTQPGDLVSGTNRRRGRSESDLSFALSQAAANIGGPGGSALDAYRANQSSPVGTINGKSNLPTGSKSSSTGTGADASSVQAAAEEISQAGENAANASAELNGAIDKLASSSSGSAEKINALANDILSLAAKVQALASKI